MPRKHRQAASRYPDRWLVRLSRRDIAELERAARHYLALGRDLGEITATDFPLERFADHLKALCAKLLHGCGVEGTNGAPSRRAPASRLPASAQSATLTPGSGGWIGKAG